MNRVSLLTLNAQLPEFEIECSAPPSRFAYPEPTKAPSKEAPSKVAAAVLSTTAKASARAKAKEAQQKDGDTMDVRIALLWP